MSQGINYLHSHSALERELKDKNIANKSHVLVDEEYIDRFESSATNFKTITLYGVTYYKIPILLFVHKGGVFKNLAK